MRRALLVLLTLAWGCSSKPNYSATSPGGGTGSVQPTAAASSSGSSGSMGTTGATGSTGSSTTAGTSGASGTSGTTGVPAGSGQLTGQLAFAVTSAYEQSLPGDGGPLSYAGFHLYADNVTCDNAATDKSAQVNGRVFGQVPVGPGVYQIIPGGGVDGGHGRLDVSLPLPDGGTLTYKASSGTITFIAVDEGHLNGTFDVTVALTDGGDASALSGSYDASRCANLH